MRATLLSMPLFTCLLLATACQSPVQVDGLDPNFPADTAQRAFVLPNEPTGGGWVDVVRRHLRQPPPVAPGISDGWSQYENPSEGMLPANMLASPDGALRFNFLTSLRGGYSPIGMFWRGGYPANRGSAYFGFRLRLSPNWDNDGANNGNAGTKIFYWGYQSGGVQHYLSFNSTGMDGRRGNWFTIGLQHPFKTYVTDFDAQPGQWNTYEVLVTANTPGRNDGRLRVWVNGQPVRVNDGNWHLPDLIERSDVLYFEAAQEPRQERLWFYPTYGGGPESPPANQWMEVSTVVMRVR